MDFSDRDYPYYLALVLFGAVIGYVASMSGGIPVLLVAGVIVEVVIGYRAESQQKAILLGAFFAVIAVTANSPIMNGYMGQGDPMTTVFVPYFINVIIASVVGGFIASTVQRMRLRH